MTDSSKLAAQAFKEIAKLIDQLSEEQLHDFVEGRAIVEFRTPEVTVLSSRPRKAAAAKTAVDLDAVATEIKGMTSEDDVERFLIARAKELPIAKLRDLAERLGVGFAAKTTAPILRKNIAAGTAGLVNRPASAFNTGWDR